MNFVVGHFLGLSQVGFSSGRQPDRLAHQRTRSSDPEAGLRWPVPCQRPGCRNAPRVSSGMAAQAAIVFPLTLGVVLTAPEIVRRSSAQNGFREPGCSRSSQHISFATRSANTFNVLLIVSNRQRLYALTYYITIALRIPLTIWGAVHWGLFGAAMAMLVSAMWNAAIWTAQVNRIIGLPWCSELASCWCTLISGDIMSIVVLLTTGPLRGMPALDVPVRLALESLIGGITYFAAHTLLSALFRHAGREPRGLRKSPTPVHYTTCPATRPAVTVSWRPRSGCGNTGRYRRAAAACCPPVPARPRCCASDPSRDRTHFG